MYTPEHRSGKSHGNADGLSRLPLQCDTSCDADDFVDNELFPPDDCYYSHPGQRYFSHSEPLSFISHPEQPISILTQLLPKMNSFDILQWQRKCPRLSSILQMLDGEVVNLPHDHVDMDLGHYVRLAQSNQIVTPKGYLQYEGRVIVPEAARSSLLTKAHDDPTSGHMAVAKTLARLKPNYY